MPTKTLNLQPLGERIMVKPMAQEEVSKGGIILPDSAKEKPQQGEVMAIGKGKLLETGQIIPMEVKVGDKVLYGKYSGTEIKLEGEEYLIIKESEIFAIIK